MSTYSKLIFIALACLSGASAAWAGKTQNVFFVIADGVRWQEVFTGADPTLLTDSSGNWTAAEELKHKYWNDDPAVRRKLLFPFLWGAVAKEGQLFGNQQVGSVAQVTNTFWFSYPGYNEMATGVADPRIDSNEYGPNPNVTVFEWLNQRPQFAGKVGIFGGWAVFADIFNGKRSGLPIRAGATLVDASDKSPRGELLNELYRTTTRLYGSDPLDSFLHVAVREHLRTQSPRVMFIGYGDTDNWQHMGRYDNLLETAHSFDGFMADLWQQIQSSAHYKDRTTLIISTDHGRGSGPVEWKDHGTGQKGSNNIWIAVIGPDTAPLGERHEVPAVTQAQIAATVAELVGEDFRAFNRDAAPSLLEAMRKRPANASATPDGKWNLVVAASDEFDGSTLDAAKWKKGLWYDTSGVLAFRDENISVSNGNLVLTARKEAFNGNSYTCGAVESLFDVPGANSYVEIRAKALPRAANVLSAVWMQSSPLTAANNPNPEIDIQETFNYSGLVSTLHTWAIDPNRPAPTTPEEYLHTQTPPHDFNAGVDVSADYHVYGLERSNGKLRFYFDGKLAWELTPSDASFVNMPRHVVLSLEGHLGDPVDRHLPQSFLVDYVRTYAPAD